MPAPSTIDPRPMRKSRMISKSATLIASVLSNSRGLSTPGLLAAAKPTPMDRPNRSSL